MAKVLFYVVRHGTTELNSADRYRGPLDVPLSDQGKLQAKEAGKFFANKPLAAIIHTERKRTVATAEAIEKLQREKVPIGKQPRLRALDVGDFAGKPKSKANEAALEEYLRNPTKVIPGGESLSAFRDRVRPLLHKAVEFGMKSEKPLLLVAHSSIIHEVGQTFHLDHTRALVEPGGAVAVELIHGKPRARAILKPLKRAASIAS